MDARDLPSRALDLETWRQVMTALDATDDYTRLTRLAREAHRLTDAPDVTARLRPVRVGVVSSATVDLMLSVFEAMLFARGLRPEFHVTPYGQVTPSLIDPENALRRFAPHITLVSVAPPHLAIRARLDDPIDVVAAEVDEICESLLEPCRCFHERTGSEIVLDNFHPLPWRAAGNLGVRLPGDLRSVVRRLNLALADRAPAYVHVNDLVSLVERVGLDQWFDERYWYLAKQPMSFTSVSPYCRQLASVVGAVFGHARKCLVVDLDNTLWGGVVGEEGVGGIEIGEGTGPGEAFRAVQEYLRQLKDRGVLLAVCSKNDESVARAPFLERPDMVLGLDDFVGFKANWLPKSENIRALARELDLGLDAFVFLDDNPAERQEVRLALPEVAVPELPDDPSGFVRALDRAALFEAGVLTNEDRQRTATYHARRQVLDARDSATDVGAYLRSLDMRAIVGPFDPASFERITQLINKTNQFNVTTPRLTRADVECLAANPSSVTLSVRLRDRFTDHGLVGVTFGHVEDDGLFVDAWLMSCRVLNRGVERLVYNKLVAEARRCGLREVVGTYKPTGRNGMVRDHYQALGFVPDEARPGVWRLSLATAVLLDGIYIADEAARAA